MALLNDEGFSLFTPLVGTAVIIVAILVGVTMMHNNAKVSKSLSNSYSASEQSLNAQYIKSISRSLFKGGAEDAIYGVGGLKKSIIHHGWDENQGDIEQNIEKELTQTIEANTKRNARNAIRDSFPSMLPSGTHLDEDINNIIGEMNSVINSKDVFNAELESNGQINVTMNGSKFPDDNFTLTFIKEGKEQKVNIIPEGFNVETNANPSITKRIENLSGAYSGNIPCSTAKNQPIDSFEIYKQTIGAKTHKFGNFTWNLPGGREMNIQVYSQTPSPLSNLACRKNP